MNFKGLRVGIIFIAALLSFVLFFAGQSLYRRYFVLDPLLREVGAIEGVEGVQVLPAEEGKIFAFQVAGGKDLAKVYGEIDGKLRKRLGKEAYAIILKDYRNKDLEEVYHRVHYAVYEAIARGNFMYLAEKVEEEARTYGIKDYRVTVDSERVYLQFEQDGFYLYEVVSRERKPERGRLEVD
ncbi:MAG TPA: hypothetical protein GX735_02840 [Firmicutes bacterium]|jgi:hypothetical protein|nr:hypothetical protein [Bacillota bacterium]